MSEPEFPHIPRLPFPKCERCEQTLFGGSHYHCGNCDSPEVTSMYGHHHSVHYSQPKGRWVRVEAHFACDVGACDAAKPVTNGKA